MNFKYVQETIHIKGQNSALDNAKTKSVATIDNHMKYTHIMHIFIEFIVVFIVPLLNPMGYFSLDDLALACVKLVQNLAAYKGYRGEVMTEYLFCFLVSSDSRDCHF